MKKLSIILIVAFVSISHVAYAQDVDHAMPSDYQTDPEYHHVWTSPEETYSLKVQMHDCALADNDQCVMRIILNPNFDPNLHCNDNLVELIARGKTKYISWMLTSPKLNINHACTGQLEIEAGIVPPLKKAVLVAETTGDWIIVGMLLSKGANPDQKIGKLKTAREENPEAVAYLEQFLQN